MRIGIFDSGVGGLTVLSEVQRTLPGHDLIYLGDTARIPYGTRSSSTVLRYSLAVASHLHQVGAEAIIVACNTATTHALPALRAIGEQIDLPVFGVIEPGVNHALSVHRQGGIGILGTPATIRGGAYQSSIAAARPGTPTHAVACPLFVPLVEEGWTTGSVPETVAETYVGHLRGRVDTVILGCTHYPMLRDVLAKVLPGVNLVDSATATAEFAQRAFGAGNGQGSTSYLTTDNVDRFCTVGARILGQRPSPVSWIDLSPPTGPFTLS